MNCAIYLRVSTERQADRYGLDSQLSACQDFADRNEYEVIEVYTDPVSGQTLERPKLQKMLKDAEAGLFEVLITYDHSRLARRVSVASQIKDQLAEYDVHLKYVTMGDDYSPSGAEGEFVDTVLDGASQWYVA